MNQLPLLIGTSRAAPPPPSAVSMLAPERAISTSDLPTLARPCVVLGGPPCQHWRDELNARHDVLYVLVQATGEEVPAVRGDAVLPSAHPSAIRRHLAHLLELKQRYEGALPLLEPFSFRWKGELAALTSTESQLLRLLFEHQGEIVGREDLARIAGCVATGSRALDAHLHRLRRKLTIPGVEIQTERQRGFRLLLS